MLDGSFGIVFRNSLLYILEHGHGLISKILKIPKLLIYGVHRFFLKLGVNTKYLVCLGLVLVSAGIKKIYIYDFIDGNGHRENQDAHKYIIIIEIRAEWLSVNKEKNRAEGCRYSSKLCPAPVYFLYDVKK